jgi:hypothetical protein
MFEVGQKVVFVDDRADKFGKRWNRGSKLKVGAVYTIKQIVPEWPGRPEPHLLLVEKYNPCRLRGNDLGYRAWRFRPVKPTSIEVFEKILREVENGADKGVNPLTEAIKKVREERENGHA